MMKKSKGERWIREKLGRLAFVRRRVMKSYISIDLLLLKTIYLGSTNEERLSLFIKKTFFFRFLLSTKGAATLRRNSRIEGAMA